MLIFFSDLFSLFSGSEMGKLYLCPVVISPWYSYFFATNLLYNTAWIFTWDREQVVAASVLLFLIAQTNIISLGILARNIAYDNHQLREEKPKIYWYENVKLCPKNISYKGLPIQKSKNTKCVFLKIFQVVCYSWNEWSRSLYYLDSYCKFNQFICLSEICC